MTLNQVLLAADVGDQQELLRTTLQDEGYEIREAHNGDDVIDQAVSVRPDVVVTSSMTPGCDGVEIVRRVRTHPATCDLPILMYAGATDAVAVRAALDSGLDDYLLMPVRAEELVLRLQSVRRVRNAWRELYRSHDLLGEHAQNLTLLLEFSASLARAGELQSILDKTLETVSALLSCRRAAILLPDHKLQVLRVAGSLGFDDGTVGKLAVPIGEGVAGRVFESGRRVYVERVDATSVDNDVYDCFLYSNPPALSMAMQASHRTVGVLYVGNRIKDRAFTQYEFDYLALISNCAASTIQSVLTQRSREEAHESLVAGLASLAEHRDNETGKHLDRMTGYCLILARYLAEHSKYGELIDRKFLENLRRAAPLHDIGKVAIPDDVLLKPGKLTPDEMAIMRTHAAVGADTIRKARARSSESEFLAMAEEIAHGHHEWFDGGGYPRGVCGAEIPLAGRIAAVADVYDALTSRRVYKAPMTHDEAKAIIVGMSGRQFDPVVVNGFLRSEDAFRALADELRDEAQDPSSEHTAPAGATVGPREMIRRTTVPTNGGE